jgi:replicative DNA helicase
MFYYPANEHVMQAITNVYNDKKPVDIITVTTEMRKMGEASNIGVFLADLSSTVITDINVATYGQEILEKYACRSAIERSMEIQQAAYDSNLDDVLIKSAEMEDTLLNNLSAVNAVDITAIFAENSRVIEERSQGRERNYIDCGIRAIDRVLGGFEPGNLIVMGGRPGMGKTAFALQLAYNISDFFPVLFFTLEMTREEIGNRYLVMLTDIDSNRLKRGEGITAPEWKLIDEAGGKLKDRKLIVDDTSHLSIYNLRSKIFRLVRSSGVKIVFIDYLQLMEGKKGKDGSEYYGSISSTCKQVAKELKIVIVLLSQLNRDVEKRGEKIPRLYDLRESGNIEQDADVVMFPVRCGFAGIDDPGRGLDASKAIIAIAKNRHGRVDNVVIKVSPNAAQWYDEGDIWAGPQTPVAQSWLKDD